MSKSNFHQRRIRATSIGTEKTENATLLEFETKNAVVVLDSNGGALVMTLPKASKKYEGQFLRVVGGTGGESTGNTCKVYVELGFGGSTSYDTIDVGIGELADFWCDGNYWFAASAVIPASS